jgi:hypothetical protein
MGFSSVSLHPSIAGPRAVKIVSNLVCGSLMLARMALMLTVLGDLSRWQSDLRFPPLWVGILAGGAFGGCCYLFELQVAIAMIACVGGNSGVPMMKKKARMECGSHLPRIVGLRGGT